jgi:thiamine kinase-like enzyme
LHHTAAVTPAGASDVSVGSATFAPVLARLQVTADALFGSAIRRIEAGREIVGPSARLLPVRVYAASTPVDLFAKRFVPTAGTSEELERPRRYFRWESERTSQAAATFCSTANLGVSRVVASFPDLLTLITERSPGAGLDRVLNRLALVRNRNAVDAALTALNRAGEWVRRFQAGVPVRDPTFRKDYREYMDIRLRALAASSRGGFNGDHRAAVLSVFETIERQVDAEELALVAIHADLCPANVVVRDAGITVIDLAMSSDGNKYVDLAHLAFHIKLRARRWRLSFVLADRLEHALLGGYDPDLRPDAPLFKLMMLQHTVCHLAGYAAKFGGWADERRLRRRVRWTLRTLANLGIE